jgi:integrase
MKTKVKEYSLLVLLNRFIRDMRKGRKLQRNGKRIRSGTFRNYYFLYKMLSDFSVLKGFPLRIVTNTRMTSNILKIEKKYWSEFYRKFTDYLYTDLDCYDNYVGQQIKLLRAFLKYLRDEKNLQSGAFYRMFYVPSEDIQIVVLSPERLNFLISDKMFEKSLPARLQRIKDTFVFGCAVALRFSDLMSLKPANLERTNERVYLKVLSIKTQTFTRIKLPVHTIAILNKYRKNRKYLLHRISCLNMNLYLKELMERAGWTETFVRTRMKRGIPVEIYRFKKKSSYRFCDMVTTHTMRRTAITSLLSVGMPENIVRTISGHAAGSKEFYRYVTYSQTHMDQETDLAFEKLGKKQLKLA